MDLYVFFVLFCFFFLIAQQLLSLNAMPTHFITLKACPNGKCFTVKHAKTLLVGKTFFRLATLFCAV